MCIEPTVCVRGRERGGRQDDPPVACKSRLIRALFKDKNSMSSSVCVNVRMWKGLQYLHKGDSEREMQLRQTPIPYSMNQATSGETHSKREKIKGKMYRGSKRMR